jgi:hypothetical protein
MWGVKTESAPRSVHPYKPILTKTYLTASCMGLIYDKMNSKERETVFQAYDYDRKKEEYYLVNENLLTPEIIKKLSPLDNQLNLK